MAVGRRITVNLSVKAEKAMDALLARGGEGITETISDAVRLYEFLTRTPGTRVYVELPPDYVPERVHMP